MSNKTSKFTKAIAFVLLGSLVVGILAALVYLFVGA